MRALEDLDVDSDSGFRFLGGQTGLFSDLDGALENFGTAYLALAEGELYRQACRYGATAIQADLNGELVPMTLC